MVKRKSSLRKKSNLSQRGLLLLIGLVVGGIGGYEYATTSIDSRQQVKLEDNQLEVRFSPRGRCLQLVQEAIQKSQKQILVQAYSFTSSVIIDELIAAHRRGVTVRILVDRTQLTGKGTQVRKVKSHGIPINIDHVTGIAHNKVMLIDGAYVLTGSFNWSNAAEYKNAENLLLIHNRELHDIYKRNWEKRAEKSTPVE